MATTALTASTTRRRRTDGASRRRNDRGRLGQAIVLAFLAHLPLAATDLSSTSALPGTESYQLYGNTTAIYPYIEYLPGGYDDDPQRLWPLLIQLHGGTTGTMPVGTTPEGLEGASAGTILGLTRKGRHFPCVGMFPQTVTANGNNWMPWMTSAFIYHALATYRIDPRRIYITGYSGGGIGCYDAVLGSSGLVTAIVPEAGWAKWWPAPQAACLVDTSIWCHYNQDDGLTSYSDETWDAIGTALGSTNRVRDDNPVPDRDRTAHWSGSAWEWTDGVVTTRTDGSHFPRELHYTVHPTGGHNVWDLTNRNEDMWTWLFHQVRADNGAPGFASTPSLTAVVNRPYTYTIVTTGSPAPTLTVTGLPSWLTLNGNVLSGTPTTTGWSNDDVPGHGSLIFVKASNGTKPDALRPFRIMVTDPAPPTIISAAKTTATVGVPYRYSIVSSGAPTPTYTVSGNPAWLTLSGNILSGTPTVAGEQSQITITATNDTVASQSFVITVGGASDIAPHIIGSAPTTATTGSPYTYTIATNGTPAAILAVSGAPAWLTLSGNVLSGTPPSAGATGMITLTATNGTAPDATQAFVIVVSDPAGSANSGAIRYSTDNSTSRST